MNYKTGNYKKALEESFISFDATLVDRQVVAKLKSIADSDSENKEIRISVLRKIITTKCF